MYRLSSKLLCNASEFCSPSPHQFPLLTQQSFQCQLLFIFFERELGSKMAFYNGCIYVRLHLDMRLSHQLMAAQRANSSSNLYSFQVKYGASHMSVFRSSTATRICIWLAAKITEYSVVP